MGDFNANSPTLRGQEWRPRLSRFYNLDAPNKGLLLRHKPSTVPNLDAFALSIGSPGLGIEVLNDTIIPAWSATLYTPNTDTGKITTGWQNQAAGAPVFGDISDSNDATYATNSATVKAGSPIVLEFRLNRGTFSTRIFHVRVKVRVSTTSDLGGNAQTAMRAVLNIGGTRYYSSSVVQPASVGRQYQEFYFAFVSNPATLVPWLAADMTAFSTGTDEIGIEVQGAYNGTLKAGQVRVSEIGLEVVQATENRVRYFYQPYGHTPGVLGAWAEKALTSTGVANGTYNYLHLFCWGACDGSNYLAVPVLRDPDVIAAANAAAATGEHRTVYEVEHWTGGMILSYAATPHGEIFPALLENGGAIASQSMPYCALPRLPVGVTSSSPNAGQTITTAASTQYGGFRLPLAWAGAIGPDAPLAIELRHSAGMLTGGGVLDATCTVQPSELPTGDPRDVLVRFPTPLTLLATTQYFLRMFSSASAGREWGVIHQDTRSDVPLAGITAAEIEGASQGGTTDSLIVTGSAVTRNDIPVVLVQAPTAPTGLAAAVVAEVCDSTVDRMLRPTRVRLSWNATALTTSFGGYTIYRRPLRSPTADWEQVGFIDGARAGYTATQVEANDHYFDDWTCPLAITDGQYADGCEYAVGVVNALTGIESDRSTTVTAAPVPTAATRWTIASNRKPWLNMPLPSVSAAGGSFQQRGQRFNFAGRDLEATQMPLELPAREYDLELYDWTGTSEDAYRRVLEAAAVNEPVALVGPRGQLVIGTLDAPGRVDYQPGGDRLPLTVPLTETMRGATAVADCDLMCGVVLNGSSQYVTHPDDARLDPGLTDFTVFVFGVFANSAATRTALGKIDATTGDGYLIGSTGVANQLRFRVQGPTADSEATLTDTAWFDGFPHLAIGTLTQAANGLNLYRDDALTAGGTATGASIGNVQNAIALTLGARNGGAAEFMALGPGIAYGYYPRVLTSAERVALFRYLANYPGYRAPANASLFVDLRDTRTWPGYGTQVLDLSANAMHGTIAGGALARSKPWNLAGLERY